jgi:solute carrier family 8 (sodium/calcium exchanger)
MLHPTKNEDGMIEDVTGMDAFLHMATIGWKVVFAMIPPPHYWGGWASFIVAISMIGLITMIVGEFATLFGCVLGLKTGVTAITFVAIGTSLPDTFASMKAATEEKYADSAVGNVTGSNSVNVFLGLGLPWVIAAIYYEKRGEEFIVPAGDLAFSVMVFLIVSVTCLITLVIRRYVVGGELGGSNFGRKITATFFVSLWVIYITLSTLKAYAVI